MTAKKIARKTALGIGQPPVAQFSKATADYTKLLEDLKIRIHSAQTWAGLAVNRELIDLYWHTGKSIVEGQRSAGWGNAVVERSAAGLQRAFGALSGFSAANVWRMRSFSLAWREEFLAQPVRELGGRNLLKPSAELYQIAIQAVNEYLSNSYVAAGNQPVKRTAKAHPQQIQSYFNWATGGGPIAESGCAVNCARSH